jgi:hypothetical protein
MLKVYCQFREETSWTMVNQTNENGTLDLVNMTVVEKVGTEECE